MVQSYGDLEVWQSGRQLVKRVYKVSHELPSSERYGLCSQMQRAIVSVPANIAEGWAAGTRPLYLRHLNVARGSLAEIETLLLLCVDLEYVAESRLHELFAAIDQLGRQLNALQQSLKSKGEPA